MKTSKNNGGPASASGSYVDQLVTLPMEIDSRDPVTQETVDPDSKTLELAAVVAGEIPTQASGLESPALKTPEALPPVSHGKEAEPINAAPSQKPELDAEAAIQPPPAKAAKLSANGGESSKPDEPKEPDLLHMKAWWDTFK